tara:strand:- start:1368 stop:1973 length:606 start_codon:yes stop_codon:yes gene_type:complete
MISVIDYDGGNYKSVLNVLKKLKLNFQLTNDYKKIINSKKIILPGVSHFGYCMNSLKSLDLDKVLNEAAIEKKIYILGICSGMQVMGAYSEEGETEGLNFVNGCIKKINSDTSYRVPHMGWNKVETSRNLLFKGILNHSRFYFCHSYHLMIDNKDAIINYTNYKEKICAAFSYKNIFGVQFHPEKSNIDGSKLISNFIKMN